MPHVNDSRTTQEPRPRLAIMAAKDRVQALLQAAHAADDRDLIRVYTDRLEELSAELTARTHLDLGR